MEVALAACGHFACSQLCVCSFSIANQAWVCLAADVKFLGSSAFLLTTSADKTARLWASETDGAVGPYKPGAVLTDHTAEVTAATLHATGRYFATASLDRTWAFYDIEHAECFTQVGRNLRCQNFQLLAAQWHVPQ